MQRRTLAFAIAVVALAAVLLWYWSRPEPTAVAVVPPVAVAPRPAPPKADAEPRLATPTSPSEVKPSSTRAATPSPADTSTPQANVSAMGSVIVRVVDDDATPRPRKGVEVTLVPLGRGGLCFRSTARSDEQGVARFEDVEVGPVIAAGDRSGRSEGSVLAKQVTELTLQVPRGCTAEGRVVGRDGQMLSQPEVWLYNAGRFSKIASCDSTGRYRVENLESGSSLAGVTREASSSQAVQIIGEPGAVVHADIVVDRPGTALLGQILDPAEHPVAGAVIGVSEAGRSGLLSDGGYMITTSDGEGRFMLSGLSGTQVLMVRTQLFAPYMEQVECKVGERIEHIVRLKLGATLLGRTTFADGKPAAGSIVVVGDMFDEMLGAVGVSDERGEYRITGLDSGLQTVRARCAAGGDDAQQDLEFVAGRTAVWNVVVPSPDGEPTTSR